MDFFTHNVVELEEVGEPPKERVRHDIPTCVIRICVCVV
jgi:hypothetical protein